MNRKICSLLLGMSTITSSVLAINVKANAIDYDNSYILEQEDRAEQLVMCAEVEKTEGVFLEAQHEINVLPNEELQKSLQERLDKVLINVQASNIKEGWNKLGNSDWVYMHNDKFINGWVYSNGNWYFIDKTSNIMRTGWYQDKDNNWYYLDTSEGSTKGRMLTGWFKDYNNNWYYANNDGVMQHDTFIDGYYLGSDGSIK